MSLGLMAGQLDTMDNLVRPILQHMVEESGETAMLTAVSYPDAICVARVESNKSIRLSFEVGRRMPLCVGASGKILLSGMNGRELDRYCDYAHKSGLFNRWEIDESYLREQIEDTKINGYLITVAEVDADAVAVSAPVLDASGKCKYGLSLAGPVGRLDPEKFIELVRGSALEITTALFKQPRSEYNHGLG
ncbi:MAG: IclR family transcriptional regulator [Bacilli bacterium]